MSFSSRKGQGGKKAKIHGLLFLSEKYNTRAINSRRKKKSRHLKILRPHLLPFVLGRKQL